MCFEPHVFVCACVQDSADTGGPDQCERRQSEQLPRGPHGKDHLCQRRKGDVTLKMCLVSFCLCSHIFSQHMLYSAAALLPASGPGGNGMGHQALEHRD